MFEGRTPFAHALAATRSALDTLGELLAMLAERSADIDHCRQRAAAAGMRLQAWCEGEEAERVRWVEVFAQTAALNTTPLSVASIFRRQLESGARAWIFTSATLSVGSDFSHFRGRMGLDDCATEHWPSPFDFERQALLYLPPGLPEPNSTGYTAAVIDALVPLIRAAGGRTFCLFTSLRAMRDARRLLAEAFAREGLDFPLLAQGEGSRSELLERFRALGNAVLVGSHSFWEGVDVRGEALSLVAIDRIPFAPPDDPVLAARIEALEREGGSGFLDYQLPEAALMLKQGVGRLIRDEADRGVMMLCDPRLVSRGYGRRILASLPPMRRTRDAREAADFLLSPAAAALPPA
jgi:ATP-dependent DNA helicase DinG